MQKHLVFLLLIVFVAGCSHQKKQAPPESTAIYNEQGVLVGTKSAEPQITDELEISLSAFDASQGLDSKLTIKHDGSMNLRENGETTKKGKLSQDELQRVFNAFYNNNFYDVSEAYLATHVVEGVSYTMYFKDSRGQGLVNFYKKGAPKEFLNIINTIQQVTGTSM